MKPGPAMVTVSKMLSERSRFATIDSAILRGAMCSGFAHCMAKVDAQSPLEESFGVSTATGGMLPSGSSPAATALW